MLCACPSSGLPPWEGLARSTGRETTRSGQSVVYVCFQWVVRGSANFAHLERRPEILRKETPWNLAPINSSKSSESIGQSSSSRRYFTRDGKDLIERKRSTSEVLIAYL